MFTEQERQQVTSPLFALWVQVGSGKHEDLVRLLAGGDTAANQMEYMKQHGSALPIAEETVDAASAPASSGGDAGAGKEAATSRSPTLTRMLFLM